MKEQVAYSDTARLQRYARDYGNVRTKKFFAQSLASVPVNAAA